MLNWKSLHFLEIAFIVLALKTLVTGTSIGDALVLMAIVAYVGYVRWVDKGIIKDKEELTSKIDKFISETNEKFKQIDEQNQSRVNSLLDQIAALKLDKVRRQESVGEQKKIAQAPGRRFF